jgi:drug/metabolite transporter (DMT)-like permease
MSLILGPALNLIAGFFWHDGSQGVTGGTLTALSIGCWLLGLIGLYERLRPRSPRYVAVALGISVFGAVGGVAFAVQAIYEQVLGVAHAVAIDRLNEYPLASTSLFWICGPLFPTALAAFGVLLFRLRTAPALVSVLIVLGAAAFPLSRITRQASIAHVADLLLLLPFLYLGVQQLHTARTAPRQAVHTQPSTR